MVEVDSTYYGIPLKDTCKAWVERTPKDFIFDVKAFRLMTLHWTEPRVLAKDLQPLAPEGKKRFYWDDASRDLQTIVTERFVDAISPLAESRKLGLVLLQFPSWIFPRPNIEKHILSITEALGGYKVAVEFRNSTWLEGERLERTLGWLREHHLTFVAVDEPQGFKSSMPPVVDVTAENAYVRFHGRNTKTWEARGKTAADRFDWKYAPKEIEEWVPRVELMAEQAQSVHVLFNTNRADQGPYNGIMMGKALGYGLGSEPMLLDQVQQRLGF